MENETNEQLQIAPIPWPEGVSMEPLNLYKKLLKVQAEVQAVPKDSENPHYGSRYADINAFLATVKPVLTKHGIILLQPMYHNPSNQLILSTQLIDAETGEKLEYRTIVPSDPVNAQKTGSGITYFRRYALQAILALEADDDDGNTASSKKVETVEFNKSNDNDVPF